MRLSEIRKRRKALGRSISKVSHGAGVNASVLSWVELGRVAASPAFRSALAGFYGESEAALFDDAGFAR